MDRSRALDAALRGWRVVGVERAAALSADLPAVVATLEAERLLEQRRARLRPRRVSAHAVEALERHLARDLRVLRDQRLVARLVDQELVLEALRVGEAQPPVGPFDRDALAAETVGPELDGIGRSDAPDDPVDHPVPGTPGHRARVLEERQVEAGIALLVSVEEVVDRGVVLVDRLLDEAQPEHARVEVHVAWSIARDRGDVMDALELHEPVQRYSQTQWRAPKSPSSSAPRMPLTASSGATRRSSTSAPRTSTRPVT